MDEFSIARAEFIAQGNPGALNVLCQLIKGQLPEKLAAAALAIDQLPLPRGPNLWILYKDECHENIRDTALRIIEMHRMHLEANLGTGTG